MRVLGQGIVGVIGPGGRGEVDQLGHGGLERLLVRAAPWGRAGRRAAQCALQAERAARARDAGARLVDGHRRGAHVRRQDRRGQLADQRLEVPGVAGAERELVVHREPQRRRGVAGPCRIRGVQPAHVHAQAGLAADLERGDEERGVARLGIEPPRAQHPGDHRGRVRRDRGGEVAVPAHLCVGPVPGVVERLQRAHVLHVDGGQRVGRHARRGVLARLEHDQRDERAEPAAVRERGGEQPGKVGVVELDAGQVVRLEVHGLVARLGPDDVPGIDADDVAGPVQVDGHLRRTRLALRGAADDGRHVEGDVQRRAVGQAGAVRLACVGADAAAQPGMEVEPAAG